MWRIPMNKFGNVLPGTTGARTWSCLSDISLTNTSKLCCKLLFVSQKPIQKPSSLWKRFCPSLHRPSSLACCIPCFLSKAVIVSPCSHYTGLQFHFPIEVRCLFSVYPQHWVDQRLMLEKLSSKWMKIYFNEWIQLSVEFVSRRVVFMAPGKYCWSPWGSVRFEQKLGALTNG